METCKTCRHWEPLAMCNRGLCQIIRDRPETKDPYLEVNVEEGDDEDLELDVWAMLNTPEDFGCSLHQRRLHDATGETNG